MPQAASVPLKKSALWGALAGLAVWLPIPVLDCIDEFLLHVSFSTPMFVWSPFTLAGFLAAGLFLILAGIIPPLRLALDRRFFF